jgi:hypothetical protein
VADHVMRMPDPATLAAVRSDGLPQISRLQRKCAQCEEEVQLQPLEEEKLQRKEQGDAADAPVTAPPIVHEVMRSPDRPLDAETRAFFEPRFGYDFSQVRVHTDAAASASAEALGANAFTYGNHIAFGPGRYNPETHEGKRLLAHEITHVLQQPGYVALDRTSQKPAEPKCYSDVPPGAARAVPNDHSEGPWGSACIQGHPRGYWPSS